MLGFPSVGYGDRDYYPTLLLSTLLGGGMSSRLFQEVREKRGLVYSIYSFSAPFLDGGLFGIYAGTGESEAEELMPVTLEELRKVQTEVTEAELARARAQVKASLLMSLESTGSRCEQLARQLQVFGRVVPTAETVAQDQRGDHRRCVPRRRAAVPRRADAGDDGAGRAGAGAGRDRGDAGGLKSIMPRSTRSMTSSGSGRRRLATSSPMRGSHRAISACRPRSAESRSRCKPSDRLAAGRR